MSDQLRGRREFLRISAAAGVALCSLSILGVACQTAEAAGNEDTDEATEPAQQENADSGSSEGSSDELTCTDTSDLSRQEIKVREALKYTDESPKSEQDCENCSLWKPADEEGTCGGCKVMAGPIHPDGWCTAWVAA